MSAPTLARPPAPDLHDAMLADVNAAIDALSLGAGRALPPPPLRTRFDHVLACVRPLVDDPRPVDWAERIARDQGSAVTIASVSPNARLALDLARLSGWAKALSAEQARARDGARRATDEAAKRLRASGIDARAIVREGSATAEIVRAARRRKADLVVVGGSETSRVLPGSVADALKDRVPSSILVARGPPTPSRITIAVDGSPASKHAAALGLSLASRWNAMATVVHVIEQDAKLADEPTEGLLRDVLAAIRLPAAPPRVRYALEIGDPADRICARAREDGAGLVVLGSRGMGAVRGLVLGSVSARVLHAADSSVLVAKVPHA